ncbi:acetate/propionate family kinase [Lutimaribacter sp. EGI FJ00015]|uniref:Acetate/propionate family kinase n=1 Tax=Lutimaribacter degradans TaxID=2945989 RepID=A0ACC5ZU52_9RHOB|nr:acetate/propionate family kinase [Lutimaribacter sp. EGI FJ00013]MCM2561718.1 acetate/propionate family kinase [Lutimaribacter sp. EGI FJ00013]MCO0612569.1 acetate/propionate family kinase [Lutimaribacter sp. EGI FJ00015]MCO0635228.1 acetate/propionate family kinase [Lutimaribacter sp. EGI FJ00014]
MSHLLVLNAGSSSLKFGLFQSGPGDPQALVTGLVERIGGAARLVLTGPDGDRLAQTDLPARHAQDHHGALHAALAEVETRFPEAEITAVGHRVVHGGRDFADPMELTPDVIARLETLVPFAPLHQPHNLAGVQAAMAEFPQARQVACFDTAFHRSHPFVNDTFALPRAYYDKGVRRYGFHGLSYDYISGALAEMAPTLHKGRVVVAHLGNGASMCGMLAGRSLASTMGFSALDGLPMGTRSGQVDPGVLLYLMEQEGMDAAAISDLLYKKSGLLGLSGISHDMRTLEESDDPHARQAIDYFTFRIRRELGGLAAALDGLDAVVFTGGIGENSARIRHQVCSGMGWIGIELDEDANAQNASVISSDLGRVRVMVIPTNEELVIARAAARLAGG